MKFGIREVANLVFRTKKKEKIGGKVFEEKQPVLYIDTATTSSLEQAATTTYAQGGRGNTRLIAWEGEKTLTVTFEDALLSPIGFSILSGAGLFKGHYSNEKNGKVHFHMSGLATMSKDGVIDLTDAIAEFGSDVKIDSDAPIYVMEIEEDGQITGGVFEGDKSIDSTGKKITVADVNESANVMVDYYIDLDGNDVYEADITADTFAGTYYVEAETLFRDQQTGKDMPANLTFPNVKLQSNFTITMASSGDPSTFTFTMDAMPDFTYFDKTKKVLAVLQIAANTSKAEAEGLPVMPCPVTDDASAGGNTTPDPTNP